MKRLTEGVYQTSDDLIVANAADSRYALFWRTPIHSGRDIGVKIGKLSRRKKVVLIEIEGVARNVGVHIF